MTKITKKSLILILLAVAIILSLFSFFEFYYPDNGLFTKGETKSSSGNANIVIEILPPENAIAEGEK